MVFFSDESYNDNDPDKKNKAKAGGDSSDIFGSAPAGTFNKSGGSAVGGDLAQRSNASGSWTNLQSYLDANQEQGTQMGQNIASGVDQGAQKATTALNESVNTFNTAVDENTVHEDEEVLGTVRGANVTPSTYGAPPAAPASSPNTSTEPQTPAEPPKPRLSETYNDKNRWNEFANKFATMYDAEYGGPTDITKQVGWGDTAKSYEKAGEGLKNLESETGRKQLLSNVYGQARPDYTLGQQNLDQMLVQRSSGAQQAMSDVRGKYNNDWWKGVQNALDTTKAKADAGKLTTETTAANALTALTTGTGNFDTGLHGKKTAAELEAERLMNDPYNADVAAVAAEFGGRNYNVNSRTKNPDGTYAYWDSPEATLGNVASKDDFSTLDALKALAGSKYDHSIYSSVGPSDQAGTFDPNPDFNSFEYRQAVSNAQDAYNNTHNNVAQALQPYIEAAQGPGTNPGAMSDQAYNLWNSATNEAQARIRSTGDFKSLPGPEQVRAVLSEWGQGAYANLGALNTQYGISDDPLVAQLAALGMFGARIPRPEENPTYDYNNRPTGPLATE